MPMVLELTPMIGGFLKFIAYLLFGFWIVLTFSWLLFSPLKNTPHWVDYLGVGSLLLQVIMVAVIFIRHVHHLGSAPTGGTLGGAAFAQRKLCAESVIRRFRHESAENKEEHHDG